MNFSESAKNIFETGFSRLFSFQEMMKNSRALIAYSGGKDSLFLLNFFYYLFEAGRIPEPIVFHLNHQIRENSIEENQIVEFIRKNYNLEFYCKKKTFLLYPDA
ncbi:MAG: PP-loop domain protein [Leptospiraceae bacterium]|nr:PP-loop domain protein [Leptospiraceae bacterium]